MDDGPHRRRGVGRRVVGACSWCSSRVVGVVVGEITARSLRVLAARSGLTGRRRRWPAPRLRSSRCRRSARRAWRRRLGARCWSTERRGGPAGRPTPRASAIDSVAVTTTSGLPSSDVSALACSNTTGYMDCSSRMLRMPRALAANACTCDAAGSGRLDHADVGRIRPAPSRVEAGEHPETSAHHRLLGGEAGQVGELVRAHRVEQHHAGDLVGVLGGVGHDVRAAGGVADEHVGTRFVCTCEQCVEVGGDGEPVLWGVDVVAPALAGAVVGADPGRATQFGGDSSPAWRMSLRARSRARRWGCRFPCSSGAGGDRRRRTASPGAG